MRRAALLSAVLATLLPHAASAQVTPERAAALQTQIRSWLQSTLGESAKIARTPVTVTAAGDHFDLAAPLSAAANAPVMTGKMIEAGSGRWAVDDIKLPSPSVFRTQLPPPTKPGGPTGEAVTTITFGMQQQQMLIDPSFASPSTATATFGDLALTTQLPNVTQLTHIDRVVSNTTVTPAADGKLDIAAIATVDGYTLKMTGSGDQHPLAVAVAKGTVTSAFKNVSRDRGVEMLHVLTRINNTVRAPAPGTKAAPIDPATTSALLSSFADLMTGGSVDEQFNDMTVATQDMIGTLGHVGIGLQSTVTDGKLQARAPISADGLKLPDLGLGDMASLIPTKLTLTPKVAGMPSGAALQLLKRALDKQPVDDRDVAALFAQGPINAGIDDFQLDVAGSSFAGTMAALVSSPDTISGTAQISATNIDKLQQAMSANPASAQMTPVLIFLKGIGRSEQNRMVWDVAYRDGSLLVNGQDMAALTGGPPPRNR